MLAHETRSQMKAVKLLAFVAAAWLAWPCLKTWGDSVSDTTRKQVSRSTASSKPFPKDYDPESDPIRLSVASEPLSGSEQASSDPSVNKSAPTVPGHATGAMPKVTFMAALVASVGEPEPGKRPDSAPDGPITGILRESPAASGSQAEQIEALEDTMKRLEGAVMDSFRNVA